MGWEDKQYLSTVEAAEFLEMSATNLEVTICNCRAGKTQKNSDLWQNIVQNRRDNNDKTKVGYQLSSLIQYRAALWKQEDTVYKALNVIEALINQCILTPIAIGRRLNKSSQDINAYYTCAKRPGYQTALTILAELKEEEAKINWDI
jgi:hypothetical protein